MARHLNRRRPPLSIEGLEGRRLLTAGSSGSYASIQAANVRHEYDHFVTEVQGLELQSQASPAEYLALRDDARAISEAAATTTLPGNRASSKAFAVSVEIDRAPLYGSLSDQAWSQEQARLERNLDGLNVPQPVVDRTIADMRAVAASAGVTSDAYQTFTADLTRLRQDESRLPAGYGHTPDPGLFYTQHLRGFFRGWAVERATDEARLAADLRSASGGSPERGAVLKREVRLLETLAAPLPSDANHRLHDALVGAFARGTPDAARLSALRSDVLSLLGTTATSPRVAAVDRLVAGLPSFFTAAGSSVAAARTVADDVREVVDGGEGSSLNPFKVTVSPAGTA